MDNIQAKVESLELVWAEKFAQLQETISVQEQEISTLKKLVKNGELHVNKTYTIFPHMGLELCFSGIFPVTAVAFTAYASTDRSFPSGARVVFETVPTNIGNGYDVSSDTFTAPVSGLYLVNVAVYTKSDRRFEAVIRKNDATFLSTYATVSNAAQAGNLGLTYMNAGDRFDVICGYEGSCEYEALPVLGSNSFSAVLIAQY